MKILVDRKELESLLLPQGTPIYEAVAVLLNVNNKLKQILTESPVVPAWFEGEDETELKQAEINNLIEITNDIRGIAARVEHIRYSKERVLYNRPVWGDV